MAEIGVIGTKKNEEKAYSSTYDFDESKYDPVLEYSCHPRVKHKNHSAQNGCVLVSNIIYNSSLGAICS